MIVVKLEIVYNPHRNVVTIPKKRSLKFFNLRKNWKIFKIKIGVNCVYFIQNGKLEGDFLFLPNHFTFFSITPKLLFR